MFVRGSFIPFFALVVVAACLLGSIAKGATFYVSPCGQDNWVGVQPGCLAPLGPKRTIQAAINAANNGDTVTVLPGVYVETIDFDGKEINVIGAAGPQTTIIDGNGDGPVVRCNSLEGPGTTLEGFTIRNGFTENFDGGGMFIALATVEIANCIFESNVADAPAMGGGLAAYFSNITVTNCEFRDNWGWFGGGMFLNGGSATVTDCVFDDNNGYNVGGGIYTYQANLEVVDSMFAHGMLEAPAGMGAALFIDENSIVSMSGCTLTDNVPAGGTSGIHIEDESSLSLVNCNFANNIIHADSNDGGGAIHASTSTVTMLGCQFSGNQSPNIAGAVYGGDSAITATFCGFVNNHADGDGGAIVVSGMSSITANLCTFNGNSSDHWRGGAIAAYYQAPIVLQGCTFSNNVIGPFGKGGALFQMGGSLLANSCTFQGNSGPEGGAVNLLDLDDEARFVDCTFTGNEALNGDGGAIRVVNAALEISGGDYENNQATARGGAVCAIQDGDATSVDIRNATFSGNEANLGGGALCSGAPTTIVESGFFSNSAVNAGGIAMMGPFGQANIVASRFDTNSATQAGSALMVGAFSPGGGAEMVNCIVSKNTSGFGGGAIHESILGASLHLANCAVVDNQGGGVIINNAATNSVIVNTVVWGNTSGGGIGGNIPEVMYCNLQGGPMGLASVSADPKFVNAAAGNYHLGNGSPCIDAGMNILVPLDEFDLDDDGNLTEFIPFDFDRESRFANNPVASDNGCGGQTPVDIGPYETPGVAVPDLGLGDANADGTVDVDDLLIVINTWGACKGDCCPADFNLDGFIDVDDLLVVINNWS